MTATNDPHEVTAAGARAALAEMIVSDPVALALILAQLDAEHHAHPAVLAARLALQVADARRALRREMAQAGRDIAGPPCGRWSRFAARHVPFTELQRRRAVPGPMAGCR